jgi:hypothetical protein
MKKVVLVLFIALMFISADAQRRDHLTETEADLMREQEINVRIEVFVKAIAADYCLSKIQTPHRPI